MRYMDAVIDAALVVRELSRVAAVVREVGDVSVVSVNLTCFAGRFPLDALAGDWPFLFCPLLQVGGGFLSSGPESLSDTMLGGKMVRSGTLSDGVFCSDTPAPHCVLTVSPSKSSSNSRPSTSWVLSASNLVRLNSGSTFLGAGSVLKKRLTLDMLIRLYSLRRQAR